MDSDLISLALQASNGVAYIHRQGWVHKDIKPSNFLVRFNQVTGRPECKLGDMGFAKILNDSDEASASNNIGTFTWIAPEVSTETGFKKSSDVWSLGCVINYIFTGGLHPFGDEGLLENIKRGKRPKKYQMKKSDNQQHMRIKTLVDIMVQEKQDSRPEMDSIVQTLFECFEYHTVTNSQ